MRKNKKRKNNSKANTLGGSKKYLSDLQVTLEATGLDFPLGKLSAKYKRMLYESRIRFLNPRSGNSEVKTQELKEITLQTRKYFMSKIISFRGSIISIYQCMLICSTCMVMYELAKRRCDDKEDIKISESEEIFKKLSQSTFANIMQMYLKVTTRLSNPCYKYFGFEFDLKANDNDNIVEAIVEIYGFPAQKSMICIDGKTRPTFRLGKCPLQGGIEWVSLDRSILGSYYTGDKSTLDVFIQSHVIERISERLDLLDKEGINYLILQNTYAIEQFEFYKGNLLLPVILFEVKVGYFVGKIVDNRIIFRTFLFITHNNTPEGDRLSELSGLGKQDISYWGIDRLSTLLNVDPDNHEELISLFQKAGIEDFMQLKEQNFSVENIQAVNIDGLLEYVKKGNGLRGFDNVNWFGKNVM